MAARAPAPGCTCCTCSQRRPRCRRIAAARAAGVAVTVETCPHYLTLSAEEIPDGHTEFKCCPPIRDADQPRRAVAGPGRRAHRLRGVRPLPLRRRTSSASTPGTSRAAWGGIASVQLGLPVDLDRGPVPRGAAGRRGPLDVRRTRGPGRARPARGAIAPGNDADLVVFAPDGDVPGRPGAAAPPQPGHAVRRRRADRRGARRLAARPRVVEPGRSDRRARPGDCSGRAPR